MNKQPKVKPLLALSEAPKANTWQNLVLATGIFWKFFRFVFPYKRQIILKLLFLLISVPLGQIGVYLNKFMIDDVLLTTTNPMPERMRLFWNILSAQLILWLIGRISVIIKLVINLYLDIKVTLDFTEAYYRSLHRLSIRSIRNRPIGENMYRTSEDIGNEDIYSGLTGMVTDDWMEIFEAIYRAAITALLISTIEPRIGIWVFCYFVPWSIMVQKYNTWYKQLKFDDKTLSQERYAVMRDIVAGLKNIKAFGRKRWAEHRYFGILNFTQRWHYKWLWAQWLGAQGPMKILDIILNRGVFIWCAIMVMNGEITIGEITVITFLVFEFLKPFKGVMEMIQRFRMKLIPAERMIQVMDEIPEIQDKPNAPSLPPLKGDVEFRNVRFGYIPERVILNNLNLKVRAGETIALVGPSGAGKSTILNLFLRLADPDAGQVLIDGYNLKDIRLKSFIEQTGVVLQDTFLFSGTIRENVMYGDLYTDEANLLAAIEEADLSDFVAEQPDGLDTWLGEGTNISGGQKQRLGIARALIRHPKVLLFDEPTAHLDVQSEHHVMKTIQKVTRTHSSFIISHRLSPIQFADRIAVIANGGLETIGTHKELLANSKIYADLWREQEEGH